MRYALVLLLAIGCAKKAADTGARNTESAPAPAVSAPTAPPPPPAVLDQQAATGPAPGGSANAPKGGSGSALDQARASGVLGPSERGAFEVKGTVTIKRSTLKAVDETVRPKLDKLQACYDKALEMQEALAGELTIEIKNGKAATGKSTLKNAELEKCVVDALAELTLPKTKATLVLAFKRE